jgi:hypothetical protein
MEAFYTATRRKSQVKLPNVGNEKPESVASQKVKEIEHSSN